MAEFSALQNSFEQIQEQLAQTLVGQEEVVEQLMVALLAGGHCLFEGAPGAARALTVAKLSSILGLSFSRVCCTSELQPEELVGARWQSSAGPTAAAAAGDEVYYGPRPAATGPSTGATSDAGPLLANVVFLDDASRLSPKAAAVIQQAILEMEVYVGNCRYLLPDPHVVLAATYTDQEPDLRIEPRDDRYMMKISIRFPSYQDEYRIAEIASGPVMPNVEPVLTPDELLELRRRVREVELPPYVLHHALRLVRATRVHEGETPDFIYEWVQSGAGTRAAHALALAAKVRAALHGRSAAQTADIHAMAHPVLRHRLVTNHNARSNGVTVDRVINRLLYEIPERVEGDEHPPD
jgi:MoxR-like ATPase